MTDNYSLTEQTENILRKAAEACMENARLQTNQELLCDVAIVRAENARLLERDADRLREINRLQQLVDQLRAEIVALKAD